MDDTSTTTNNAATTKPKHKSPLLETLKNFIFMLPLASIIFYQIYLLGNTFGEFLTFPPLSVITYIFIGCLLLLLLILQIMMRSIIYSVITGVMLVLGIFSAWFGDVCNPIINNLSKVLEIIQSAWTQKSIPFELLMTGIMTTILGVIAFTQFATSLIVKSFFEMILGKKWGDGKWLAFVGAIALILGVQLSFNSYINSSNSEGSKLIWKNYQKYSKLEKFISKTEGSVTYNDEYVWVNDGSTLKAYAIDNGKEIGSMVVAEKIFTKGIEKSELPIVGLSNKFVCYSPDLKETLWEIFYPELTASDSANLHTEVGDQSAILIPLTRKFVNSGKYMLAIYDFGKIAMYDLKKGEELWLNVIDQPVKVSRLMPDKFLDEYSYLETNSSIVFACHNGYVKSVDMRTGKIQWEYQHAVAKSGGIAQRGFLSQKGNNIVVAFKTGEIVTISSKDGHLINKTYNEVFTVTSPVYCFENKAQFLTEDGLYYTVELDSGKIENRLNALPNKAELYPILQNNENKLYAHREKVYLIDENLNYSKLVLKSKNRTFVTNPVFKDKTVYIGTSDGWIYCFNLETESVKWLVHVNGELGEDSLCLTSDKLLVKSKSDSVFLLKQ